MIEPEPLQQVDRTHVLWRRRKLSFFSGCDYFRLSTHPRVQRALVDGLKQYGLSVSASRRTSGNHKLYLELEKRLARFFNFDTGLLVSTGYVANLAAAQALAGQFSHVLIDEAAHPSLGDAAALLLCPILKFGHRSTAAMMTALDRCGPACKPIVLTDGLFARDGTIAPLQEYLSVLPRDGALLVDDAHGAGVLGTKGQGSVELAGINRRRVILTITLSKAFGVYGGAILGSSALKRRIEDRSQIFVGSTPLPLPLANAASRALAILGSRQSLRARLVHNTRHVRTLLQAGGVPVPDSPGPIIALQANRSDSIPRIKKALTEAAIFPPFIRYPGGPASGYFRFVISSEHTREQLDNLASCLTQNAHQITPVA